ncbi:hypothetical protein SM124_09105 [Bacillus sp. 31A1R]|uniref:Uncharacterized protein n=1 Tax=Robertmurraya mangrovi TaxID=3098077 RepID=A0ABU5IXK4_9BACI|nr:hypothetical protein [Bacillus sp. 31A1R]MDZ5471904.1 hypothetical protein [Bacillus sp. 31A1R]
MTTLSPPETITRFLEFSETLPDMKMRTYEVQLTKYASQNVSKAEFDLLLTWLKERVPSSQPATFECYFVLCIYSRRMKNFSIYRELLRDYGAYFEHLPLYYHIEALYYKQFDTPNDIEMAMSCASKAAQHPELSRQVGVLHSYVESVVKAEEHKLNVSPSILEDAMIKINEVVRLDNHYAKFHCTRGRLLALRKDFTEARRAIHKAIDLEDSTITDYSIRINDYQSHLTRIQMEEKSHLILKELYKTKEEFEQSKENMVVSMEKLQKDNLQFLGFFVAIISLTIGSLNMIGDKSFHETAYLIMILTGCILLGYVSLGMLFQPKQVKRIYQVYIFLIGLLLIVGPFLVKLIK